MNRFIRLIAGIALACSLAPGADLSGKWVFTWDTEGGVRESSMVVKQEGDKLSARLLTALSKAAHRGMSTR